MSRKRSIEDWVRRIQPDIDFCLNCQARESGEWIWVLGSPTDLRGLLEEYEVPENVQEDVADGLQCLHCGTELDIYSEIGLKSAEEREDEERANRAHRAWVRKHSKPLEEFISFLEKCPYLGATHLMGKRILKEIQSFPTLDELDGNYWRARLPKGGATPSTDDMGPPPRDKVSSEGRFNHYGQRVLYLADSAEAAAREILNEGESLVWIQEWKVGVPGPILDLGPMDGRHEDVSVIAYGLDYTDSHRKPADSTSPWKPQYFLPRYIADCARHHGFSGVRFTSSRHYAHNVVLFWTKKQVRPRGEPHVIQLQERLGGYGTTVDF